MQGSPQHTPSAARSRGGSRAEQHRTSLNALFGLMLHVLTSSSAAGTVCTGIGCQLRSGRNLCREDYRGISSWEDIMWLHRSVEKQF